MEAASNNGIFPLLTTRLDGGFGPHPHQAWFTPQAISTTMCRLKVWQCADAALREQQNPKTVITRPQLPSLPFEPLLPFFLFWVTSIFEQYACFQMRFRSQLHVCWWIPESFSNHPVIQHVKNFQPKSWGLKKLCRYKSNYVRAVLFPASYKKAGRRPSLVSRLPNILHGTNLCLLSAGQILISWPAKQPFTKCFSIGNIHILSCGTLPFYVYFIRPTSVWWGNFSGRRLDFHNLVIKAQQVIVPSLNKVVDICTRSIGLKNYLLFHKTLFVFDNLYMRHMSINFYLGNIVWTNADPFQSIFLTYWLIWAK